MIFREISIQNFGIYDGIVKFDLTPDSSEKNIILIGAKNGAGKTTLLNSIKIGLYGPLSFGFKHINTQYKALIKEKMNKSAFMRNENQAGVTVKFSMGVNGASDEITIKRQWFLENSDIKETLSVFKNNESLSSKEAVDFENFVRKFWPPSLFEFFLFDGEDIHLQLNEDRLLINLKEAFFTLLNLDLVYLLKEDSRNYLLQANIFEQLDLEQKNYTAVSQDFAFIKLQFEEEESELLRLEQRIKDLKEEIVQFENEFRLNGGLLVEARENAKNTIIRLEQGKKEAAELLRNSISELLPFFMVKDLLKQTHEQVSREQQYTIYHAFAKTGIESSRQIYEELILDRNIKVSRPGVAEDYSRQLLDDLIDSLISHNKTSSPIIHDLNESEKYQLYSIVQRVDKFNPKTISDTIKKITTHNSKISKLNKQVYYNRDNQDLNQLLQDIQGNNNKSIEAVKHYEQLRQKHQETTQNMDKVAVELERIEKKITQAQKDENIFAICHRMDKALDSFIQEIIRVKTSTFKKHFLNSFLTIIRKDDFIKDAKVNFNTQDFKITLIDNDNNPIKHSLLSAGEKQIFLLSITWALIKTSGRETPIFFDTLLGRLDTSHREKIINNLLPYISPQVIVLSTDTEIDAEYYELIKPRTNREYTLTADSDHSIVIENKYFDLRRNFYALQNADIS